ncbi:MAG: hypothetical protein ABIF40_00975 [archaeon]
MEHIEQCAICKKRLARYACRQCGLSVCKDCYDEEKGICLNCKQGIQ